MTIRELRNILYEIENQDMSIEDNLDNIINLGARYLGICNKIDSLYEEKNVSPQFIKGWIEERDKAFEEIRNYKAK